MSSARTTLQQTPPWTRVWLSALLLLGVLSMHGAIISDEGGLIDHHGTTIAAVQSSVSAVVAAGEFATHFDDLSALAPLQNGESDLSMSDCGGLSMLCLAMIVAGSAYIALRRSALNRISWQLAPNFGTTYARPSGPFEARSPRERSSVLRR